MNPAEGLQMHFLSLQLYVTKRRSAPQGADTVKCTNSDLMVRLTHKNVKFLRNPKSLRPFDGQSFLSEELLRC